MLIEREDSLSQLRSLAEQSVNGKGNVALIGGEAGIGKTTLLQEFRSQTPNRQKLFWGGSDALFTPMPLGPLHDMAPLFSKTLRTDLSEGASPSQLYSSLILEIEKNPPGTILVFEDAHWADYATLDLLKYVGRRISMLPAMLVISFRNDEVDGDHPLTRVLGELPPAHTTRLDLKPLSKDGVASLGFPATYTIDELYNVTGGNPFFVTELLACRDNATIPASVKDAVDARLVRLASSERELLETVSVIPGSVSINLLCSLFGEQGETLAMACVGRNLLVQDNFQRLRFRHELARLATLARIPASKQKELHAKVFAALFEDHEQQNPNPLKEATQYDQMVHHAAGAFNSHKVLEFAPLAAKRAASLGAHSEAAAHLATALRFVDEASPEIAAQLYEDWAYEAGLALRIDDEVLEARRHAITLWRALERPDKVGENLRWLSRLHWYRGEATKAGYYADEAIRVLEEIPPSAERAMAYSLRSQAHMLNDRMDDAIEWGYRALELAKTYNNAEVQIHALNNIGTAKIFRNNADGINQMNESLRLALKEGFHEHAARVYTNLAEYAVEFKNFSLAERTLSEGIAFDTHHDLFAWTYYLIGRQAQLRMEQGRLRDAETIASGALKTERLTLLMRLPALTVLAKTRMRLGREDAGDLLSEALTAAIATDELQYIVPVRLGLIESAWLQDRPDLAKEHLEFLNEQGASAMHHWSAGETAVWAHRFNKTIKPEFLEDLPEPHRLEIAGDPLAAASHWENLSAPYSAAVTLLAGVEKGTLPTSHLKQAQSLLDPIEAQAAFNKLRRMAAQLNADDLVVNNRRGPYRAARNHPMGLTKREQEILLLLSKGASNKDIAEVLHRSQRTVEHHVSAILTKLNASTRMEAMLRVHNEPWLLPDDVSA